MLNDPNGYDWPMVKPPPYEADDENKTIPLDEWIDQKWIEIDNRIAEEHDAD